LFDPSPSPDDHPPAPLPSTHYPLAMCGTAWSKLPGEGSTGTLSREGEIVTFEISLGRPDKCPHNSVMTH
jgi:hypothetical protein